MQLFTSKLKSATDFYTQIVLILVIVLLVNLVFSFAPWRFDISEGRVYSISSVTKETLKDLDDIITIKAYFTKDLPGYYLTVRQQVQDILAEYKNYGGHNIRINFLNPNESPQLEEEAQRLGLPPLQFNIVKKDKLEVAQGYLGLAVLYGDKKEVIPVVQDIISLEYDLTAAIKKVIAGEDLTVGILQKPAALPVRENITVLRDILSKQYTVRYIDLTDEELISPDVNTLIVPGPVGEFTQRELYIIDQFVMSGRGVLIAIDGLEVGDGLTASPNESNLFKLLKSYGVSVNKDLVYDTVYRGSASFSRGLLQFFTPYGYWPKVLKAGFNQESILVNKLEALVLPWVSSIEVEEGEGVQILVRTSPKSLLVKDNIDLNPQSFPQASGEGGYPVIVSITGHLKSYFDEPVAKAQIEERQNGERQKEVEQARLIVISDADLIKSGFIQRYEDNLIFLQNLIDGLTLEESLAAIRSKAVSERPLRELDDTARSLVKYGNIIGVPVLVVLFAIIKFIWRRKSQRINEVNF